MAYRLKKGTQTGSKRNSFGSKTGECKCRKQVNFIFDEQDEDTEIQKIVSLPFFFIRLVNRIGTTCSVIICFLEQISNYRPRWNTPWSTLPTKTSNWSHCLCRPHGVIRLGWQWRVRISLSYKHCWWCVGPISLPRSPQSVWFWHRRITRLLRSRSISADAWLASSNLSRFNKYLSVSHLVDWRTAVASWSNIVPMVLTLDTIRSCNWSKPYLVT